MKLAFCGNNCNECPRYAASQSGDREHLKEVAALWKRVGYRDEVVSPEEIRCQGCVSSAWCRYDIRACGLEKGVRNCGECTDYPCTKILETFQKTETFRKRIKETCAKADYGRLHKAFFEKKTNLDRAHSGKR